MNDLDVKTSRRVRFASKCRRAGVASVVTVGTVLAGAGVSHAQVGPPGTGPDAAAGQAIDAAADRGANFVVEYVLPAIGGLLGFGFLVAVVMRYGKKIRSAI